MKKWKLARLAAIPAGVMGFVAAAHAELPTGIETAINEAATDAKSLATTVFVALVGIYAIKLLRRAL